MKGKAVSGRKGHYSHKKPLSRSHLCSHSALFSYQDAWSGDQSATQKWCSEQPELGLCCGSVVVFSVPSRTPLRAESRQGRKEWGWKNVDIEWNENIPRMPEYIMPGSHHFVQNVNMKWAATVWWGLEPVHIHRLYLYSSQKSTSGCPVIPLWATAKFWISRFSFLFISPVCKRGQTDDFLQASQTLTELQSLRVCSDGACRIVQLLRDESYLRSPC